MESVGNQGGQILDIGCAAGYFLSEAMSQGWKAFGMDVSPWAEKKVKMLPNVEFARNLESYRNSRSGEFEAVAMAQVLEHTVHPDILVEEAFALLRPGGTLFVETWNLESTAARIFGSRWQQISPPSVVHLFSQRGLIAMLKRFGFEKVIVRRGVKFVSADLVLHIIEQKYPWLTGVSLKNRLISLLRHTAIPYFLGDLIHVTASKPSP
jgi:SAM-dependent methyltransferase